MTHSALLIGLGAVGMGYDLDLTDDSRVCTHAHALYASTAFGPLCAVDPDAQKRLTFEAKYRGSTYAAVSEALATHSPELVIIATPTALHAQTLAEVLRHSRPRAILCEKPLAPDLAEAETMLGLCEQHGVPLYVNYMRRADPAVTHVRQRIESGAIEGPLKGVVWYSKGLVHNGSHFVDLVRHWLGPVQQATLIRAGRRWHDQDPEPDFATEHARGSVCFLAAREECFSHYTVELIARNGRLRYEESGERVEWQAVVEDADFSGYRILSRSPERLPAAMERYQLHVLEELERALRGHATVLCSGREALGTLRDIYRVLALC